MREKIRRSNLVSQMGADSSQSSVVGHGLTTVHSHQAQRPQHGQTEATEPWLGVFTELQCRGFNTNQSVIFLVLTSEIKNCLFYIKTTKFTILKYTIHGFSIFTQLYNHHHYLIPGETVS